MAAFRHAGVSQGVGVGGTFDIPDAPSARTNVAQPWERYVNADRYLLLRAERDLGTFGSAYAAYGWGRADRRWLSTGATLLDRAGSLDVGVVSRRSYFDKQTGEVGVRGKVRTGPIGHQLTFAMSRYQEYGSDNYFDSGITLTSNLYRPVASPRPADSQLDFSKVPPTSYSRFLGAALADTVTALDDRVILTVGIRRQNVVSDTIGPGGQHTRDYDASAWTPLVGLVVKPAARLSVYANYIEGLQRGSVVGLPYRNAGEVLPPYRSVQYEVGAKYDFGRFGATLSVFQIARPNTIATPPFAREIDQSLTLDGEQRNRGVEVNVFGDLVPGLRLLGGVMLLDARLTRTQDGASDGARAGGAPEVNVNMGVDWKVPFAPRLSVLARGIYTSRQFVDESNTQFIPPSFRLDLGGSYAAKIGGTKVVFRANVENVFDRGYWSSAARGYLSFGKPRTMLLSASFGL